MFDINNAKYVDDSTMSSISTDANDSSLIIITIIIIYVFNAKINIKMSNQKRTLQSATDHA